MTELIVRLADQLVSLGLEFAFGVTGSGPTWTLISALEDRGVRYQPAGHEAAAAMMAGGAMLASRRVSLALSIKGPGVVNLAAGLAYNHFENTPILSVAEAYAANASPTRMHKRMDQGTLLRPLVKGTASLTDVGSGVDALLAAAREEIPGPVHLSLTADPPRAILTQPRAGGDSADPVVRRIERSERPLVIAGGLATRMSWGTKLRSLRVPVLTTGAGRGSLNEGSPFAAGIFTGEGKELAPERVLLERADLVVGLGLRNLEVITPIPFSVPFVSMDVVGENVVSGFDADSHTVVGSIAEFESVIAALAMRSWGDDEVAVALGALRAELLQHPWLPARCFALLDEQPWPHALVLDTGSFCTIAEHVWRAGPPAREYFGSNNGRFMGAAIPTAIGVSLAAPERAVVCAFGDGGLRMYPAEAAIAVESRLPICFLLLSDGRYGSIASARDEPGLSQRAIRMPAGDWVRVFESLGCAAVSVTDERGFRDAMGAWSRRGPLFVQCSFAPTPYREMTRRLR